MSNVKVKDAGIDISEGSRLDEHWKDRGFVRKYLKFRSPQLRLKNIEGNNDLYENTNLYNKIVSDYGFKGIEFGNWVNNEARYNYMIGAVIALYDLNKVLKFPHDNLGFGKIGLAFGARGSGKANGHYEPLTQVINITRYDRNSEITRSGGVSVLAHEYGHALDYHFGTHHNPSSRYRSITRGSSTAMYSEGGEFPINTRTLSGLANKIVQTAIWTTDKEDQKTEYYLRLEKRFGYDNEYWFRHNEIFARLFENYIQVKLEKLGIVNSFLTQKEYGLPVYPDKALMKKIVPLFDKLVTLMRSKLK